MENIYGINPVTELLNAKKRKCYEVLISDSRSGSEISNILDIAKKNSVKVKKVRNEEIGKKANTKDHQGVLAFTDKYPYANEDAISGDFFVIADGIQDPHNLGAVIRTAYLLGVDAVIIPERGAASITGTVAKASAGAIEYIDIAKATNISRFIKNKQEEGFWAVGLDAESNVSLCNYSFSQKTILVVGGEGHGIRRLVRETCDDIVFIPQFASEVKSLNASVAAALAMYEVSKQKKCQSDK